MKESVEYIWMLSKGHRRGILSLILLGVADVSIALTIVAQTKSIIDAISAASTTIIWQRLLLQACSMLLSISIRETIFIRTTITRNNLRNNLHSHYFNLIIRAEWRSAKGFHSGDIMSRMERDVEEVVSLWISTIPYSILTLVKLSGALVFLYVMEAQLATIIAALVPIVLLASRLYVKKMRNISHQLKDKWSSIHKFLQESIQQTDVLKAFAYEGVAASTLRGRQDEYMNQVIKQNRLSLYSHIVISLGFTLGYMLTFSWGIFSLKAGVITFGTMMAMLQLVGMIQGPALGLAQSVPSFISAYTSQERLKIIDNLPAERNDLKEHQSRISSLNIEDVAFSYNENEALLENINWVFESGKIYALTGRTGCGKTTVVRLLLGFVKPLSGKLYMVSGDNLIEVDDTTRAYFSYVPQESLIFSGTIGDNIKMGRDDASKQEVESALIVASAQFVFDLPQGLDTPINERGGGLSGGQIQRLAIARALLSKAPILLLDEFTSALDADTEREIITNLKNNIKDRIVILISHKSTLVDICDYIYQL